MRKYHEKSGKLIPINGMPKAKKGVSCMVQPIRDINKIEEIKSNLYSNTRNYALFVLGINTALRANEILSLRTKQIMDLSANDGLKIYQSKTKSYRVISLNHAAISAVKRHIEREKSEPEHYIFENNRCFSHPIGVGYFGTLIKGWCADVGLRENYGSHTLRKTWGYMQRKHKKTPTLLLKKAFGHRYEWQTIAYLGIEGDEINALYEMEL